MRRIIYRQNRKNEVLGPDIFAAPLTSLSSVVFPVT
jgi:hypothetical protein